MGRDGRKTYLKIDLTRSPGTWGSCGVKYDQKTEERRVTIAVRAHPTIELLEDRIYKVTCGRAGFQNSRNSVSIVQLRVVLPSNPDPKIDTVLPGKPYKLRAEVLDHDRKRLLSDFHICTQGGRKKSIIRGADGT